MLQCVVDIVLQMIENCFLTCFMFSLLVMVGGKKDMLYLCRMKTCYMLNSTHVLNSIFITQIGLWRVKHTCKRCFFLVDARHTRQARRKVRRRISLNLHGARFERPVPIPCECASV